MKKKTIIFITIFIISLFFIAQGVIEKKIAELEKKLKAVSGKGKVDVLNDIAYMSYSQSSMKCIKYGNQALELSQKINYIKGEARALINIGIGNWILGNNQNAIEYFQKSLKIYEEIGDKKGVSNALNNIGSVYGNLSNYEKALEFFQKSLKIREEIGGKKGIANALNNIGSVYGNLGNYEKTLECYLKSLKIFEEIGDKQGLAYSLYNIGLVFWNLSNYEKALEYYQKSLKIYEEVGNKQGIAYCLHDIGIVYSNLSNYEKDLEYSQKSLKIREEIGDKRGIANSLHNIGIVYVNLGNYEKALEYYLRSLKIGEEIGDKRGIADALNYIGVVYWNLSNYEKALEYYLRSLKIGEEIGDKRGIADVLVNIGILYWNLNNEKRALEYQMKSLKIYKEIGYKWGIAASLVHIGKVYDKLNNFSESNKFFNKALVIGREIGTLDLLWEAYSGIASNYKHQKNFVGALNYYKKAIEIIEDVRTQLKLDEHKAGFIESKIDVYEHIINLLFRLHQRDPLKGYDKECFYFVEKAKARAFLDSLEEANINIKENLSAETREREKKISMAISKILTDLQKSDISKQERKKLFNKLEKAEDEYNRLIIRIKKENPEYTALMFPEPYELEQVQEKLLDRKTALIEYFIGEKYAFKFLVTKSDLFILPLYKKTAKSELEDQIESTTETSSLIDMVDSYIHILSLKTDNKFHGDEASRQLYGLLLAPFIDQLPDEIERLIIIPDRNLFYLAFETLLLPKARDEQTDEHRRYLIGDYQISYAASASSLINLVQKGFSQKRKKDLLAIGDPVYNIAPSGVTRASRADQITRGSYIGKGFRFPRLHFSSNEIESVSKFFKEKRKELILRERALEENIKKIKLDQFKIIHFATHGLLDDKNGKRSALVLTLDDDPTEDGFLQAREVYNLQFNADLVILSACQTGRGKLEKGEGVTGLSRAFSYAGAKSVLSTLWRINDQSTVPFMTYFYKCLSEGKSKVQALQEAKLKMINSKYNHPFYWASFVLFGDYNSSIIISKQGLWERLF